MLSVGKKFEDPEVGGSVGVDQEAGGEYEFDF